MTTQTTPLLQEVENYVVEFFATNFSKDYVFHDLEHTRQVVQAAMEIGQGYQLAEKDMTTLLLAAWFHDLGYSQGPANHEDRSIQYAVAFLEKKDFPAEDLQRVRGCIESTRVPQQPKTLLEQILCDADLSHLGQETYWERTGKVRQEMVFVQGTVMDDREWVDFEINFLQQHRFHTLVAAQLYDEEKQRHIRQLFKQKARLNPNPLIPIEIPPKVKKKKDKVITSPDGSQQIEIKDLDLGRGVETMYRTTYRTHITMSTIADNKANIMLSINAIIISIIVSTLVPKFGVDPNLILPTVVLLVVCLTTIIFATLATKPNVTTGRFTREDIENKSTNLLFFGNYYNMTLEDFEWGMMEMIRDNDFLYGSMTRDLYYLGVVLAKKYFYLRLCYIVFMYGIILAVGVFAAVFLST